MDAPVIRRPLVASCCWQFGLSRMVIIEAVKYTFNHLFTTPSLSAWERQSTCILQSPRRFSHHSVEIRQGVEKEIFQVTKVW